MKSETPAVTTEPRLVQTIDTDRQFFVVRFSPCGKFLFGGSFDAAVNRWDTSGPEFQPLPSLAAHRGWVSGLVFAPQGQTVYTADSWGQVCAWPYADATPKPIWKNDQAHDGWIRALAVSQDGRLLATCGRDQVVRVWNAADGSPLHAFTGHAEDVYCVAIHPDGKSVVSGDLKGNLYHWDLASGKRVRETRFESMYFYDRIQDVAGLRILQFHDDGQTLVCAGSEPTKAGRSYGIPVLHLVDWKTLEITKSLRQGEDKDGYVFDLSWHASGYFMIATSGTPGTGMLAFRRSEEDEPFYVHSKLLNCHSLAPHPDGNRLVVATINARNQGNGTVLDKEGKYLGNWSPLHLFDLTPEPKSSEG